MSVEATGYHKFNIYKGGFRPGFIVIHHSYSSDDNQTRNWDAIKKYHVEVNGWSTIGYHLGVERVNGKLELLEGRAIGTIGAHAKEGGFNRTSIGICLVGNYDEDPPSEDRLFFVASICRDLQGIFDIPRINVIGHRETYGMASPPMKPKKSCPGKRFDMDAFRARLVL